MAFLTFMNVWVLEVAQVDYLQLPRWNYTSDKPKILPQRGFYNDRSSLVLCEYQSGGSSFLSQVDVDFNSHFLVPFRISWLKWGLASFFLLAQERKNRNKPKKWIKRQLHGLSPSPDVFASIWKDKSDEKWFCFLCANIYPRTEDVSFSCSRISCFLCRL